MIGQRLREAREAKGCTLEDAERVTRIRAKFLAALEDEAFGALPSEAHARGFLRNYAQFLGLDADQAVAQFNDGAGTKLRFPLPRVASRARRVSQARRADFVTGPLKPLAWPGVRRVPMAF
jgi:cytoskeletal protein RodZ